MMRFSFFFAVSELKQICLNYIESNPLDKYLPSSARDMDLCEFCNGKFKELGTKLQDVRGVLDFSLEGAALDDNFGLALQIIRDIVVECNVVADVVNRRSDRVSKLHCHYAMKIMVSHFELV